MRLYRVLPWDVSANPEESGGPLWFPREFQGPGRHDNPDAYGALYVSADAVCAVAERLASFRGQDITPLHLTHSGRALALAEIDLLDEEPVLDLNDPQVLVEEGLRPSQVATMQRRVTQRFALDLFQRYSDLAGFAWWSTLEASYRNVTLYDRTAPYLSVEYVIELSLDDTVVQDAMAVLGLVQRAPARPAQTGVQPRTR